MKKSTKTIAILAIIVIAVFLIIRSTGDGTPPPGKYDTLAKCITESGAKMYGAYWCPHCLSQKKLFGTSFQYINYIECDPRGNNANPDACEAAGVTGYPTWTFTDGERRSGEIPLRTLAQLTSCEMPVE